MPNVKFELPMERAVLLREIVSLGVQQLAAQIAGIRTDLMAAIEEADKKEDKPKVTSIRRKKRGPEAG